RTDLEGLAVAGTWRAGASRSGPGESYSDSVGLGRRMSGGWPDKILQTPDKATGRRPEINPGRAVAAWSQCPKRLNEHARLDGDPRGPRAGDRAGAIPARQVRARCVPGRDRRSFRFHLAR